MLEQLSLSKCPSCPMAPHLPTLLGPHSSKQGSAQGCGQHSVNRDGSGRGCSASPLGLQHWCSPWPSAQQDGGTALPILMPGPISHHHLPGSFRALGRSNGHHHPTTSRSGTTAHAPGSVFDCNTAVTDFPLLLAWAFLLRLSFPFLSSPINSPLPIPVLLPGTGREDGNTRISVSLEIGTWMQDSTIQTPN